MVKLFESLLAGGLYACLMAEIGLRIAAPDVELLTWRNFVAWRTDLFSAGYPATHDALLGYVPTPGAFALGPLGGSVTIDERGVRSNGVRSRTAEGAHTILAVGDSFTFGDEVDDHQTWPASLERLSGHEVINGGVFGYGLDQSVLRAEQLAAVFEPSVLLVSFIPDNISRAELSMRTGVAKPYFSTDGGELVLNNVPVPDVRPKRGEIGMFRRVAGYSLLVDWMMRRTGHSVWWYAGGWRTQRVHTDGDRVACALMRRLRTLAQGGIAVVVVAQYYAEHFLSPGRFPGLARSAKVLECARAEGLHTIDLYHQLDELRQSDADMFASMFTLHMTAAGNAFVAARVNEHLPRLLAKAD